MGLLHNEPFKITEIRLSALTDSVTCVISPIIVNTNNKSNSNKWSIPYLFVLVTRTKYESSSLIVWIDRTMVLERIGLANDFDIVNHMNYYKYNKENVAITITFKKVYSINMMKRYFFSHSYWKYISMNLSSKITVLPAFSQPIPLTTFLLRLKTRVQFDFRIVSNNNKELWIPIVVILEIRSVCSVIKRKFF